MDVKILDSEMKRKSGYGQYSIKFDIISDGFQKTISFHSTDSQLFDDMCDDYDSERLLNAVGGIEMIINSLND
jgi:hypothetical protein